MLKRFSKVKKSVTKKYNHLHKFLISPDYRSFNSLIKVSNFYINKVAPILAFIFQLISFFLIFLIKKKKIIILSNNITNSPGHVSAELDFFFRKLYCNKISNLNKYVIIWPKSQVSVGANLIYKEKVSFFIISDFLYRLILILLIRYPEVSLDCSLSHVNYLWDRKGYFSKFALKKITKVNFGFKKDNEVLLKYNEYYDLRKNSENYYPMSEFSVFDIELKNFLGTNIKKYALIQIKNTKINATLSITEPDTYIKSIKYLKDHGYKIIFSGREKMPNEFKHLDILNYSEWKGASFSRDLQLVKNSQMVLSSASGFGLLADTMNIPLVWSNFWQLGLQLPGKNTIVLPTLLKDKQTNLLVKFKNQLELFVENGWKLNYLNQYSPVNASENEILEAVKEILELKKDFIPMSEKQKNFNTINKNLPSSLAMSRISSNFLNQHIDLM